MKTALVTGGAGFVGSHVAEHLLAMGIQVVVLDDLSGGFTRNMPTGCRWFHGSIEDHALIEDIFRHYPFNYVFHLAAYAAEGLSHFVRRFNYRVNLLGSINVLTAAINHGVECFVFSSSAAVYGFEERIFCETDVPRPMDPYAIAKLAVENDIKAATELFGIQHIIFRPHNVYGERQNMVDPFRNVIAIFMRQVMEGKPCSVFGDGTQSRAFSYVGDVAPLIAGSVLNPRAKNETFNIGASKTNSLNELAEMIQVALGRQVGIEHLSPRAESKHISCDHSKIERFFGLIPTLDLKDGIRRMADWARTVELRPGRPGPRLEIVKGLPQSWAEKVGKRVACGNRDV